MTGSSHSTPPFSARHLDDAELVRLLDAEHSADERAHWEAHVATCTRCSAEVDRLRADAAVVRVWLDRAAFERPLPHVTARVIPARAAVARAPWLRAAATIALIALPITAVAAIPPLRDWFAAAIDDLRGRDQTVDVAPAARSAPQPVTDDRIRFAPAPGSFTVQLDAAQSAGTLRIAYTDDPAAKLAVLDRAGVEAVVSESAPQVRLRNTGVTDRNYALQVPLSVTAVTVRIDTRTIAVLDAAVLRTGRELSIR